MALSHSEGLGGPKMKLEIVSEDARGWIAMVKLPDGKEAIMIFTRKGYLRGGEFHHSWQHDVVLHGALQWLELKGDELVPVGSPQIKGESGRIPPGEPHIVEAVEDTLYIEWLTGEFEKTFVPELRKLVDEQMKK